MVKTVVRAHSWLPFDVYRMYLDDQDALGLVFWFEDVESSIVNGWTEEQLKAHKASLTVPQLNEFNERHNPEHEVHKDTGEWYLKQ